jgi:hypothetical protein
VGGSVPAGNPWAAAQAKRGKLHDIQNVINTLRTPVDAPDLSAAILSRVDAQRPFTDVAERRWIWAGRLSVAAGLLMLLGAVYTLHCLAPEQTTWAGRAAPLSAVIDNAETEVGESLQTIRSQIATVGGMVPSLEVPVACQPKGCVQGGCWASPVLTLTTPAGDGPGPGATTPFVRLKAEFLHDRYVAARTLETKPVTPPAPH